MKKIIIITATIILGIVISQNFITGNGDDSLNTQAGKIFKKNTTEIQKLTN